MAGLIVASSPCGLGLLTAWLPWCRFLTWWQRPPSAGNALDRAEAELLYYFHHT